MYNNNLSLIYQSQKLCKQYREDKQDAYIAITASHGQSMSP